MRYNTKTAPTTVVNHEGATAVKLNPKFELISIITTGFNDNFYESMGERENRFIALIKDLSKKDIDFVAKALIYARTVVGQRTVTHFGATHLAAQMSGNSIARRFFSKRVRGKNMGGIIYRLDDILEIVACYQHFNPGKPLSGAMKKGFKMALEQADKYELAKYQGKGKKVSLVDVVNLVHPKPSPEMASTFKALMEGNLKQFDTVEDKNTASGQEVAKKLKDGVISQAEATTMLSTAKEDNYRELITSGKIGYLALLRNLRNINKNTKDQDLIKAACDLLTNENFIKKSLVFPHQIDLAFEVLVEEGIHRDITTALNTAYELSIPNLTKLFEHGTTAVVVDTSASMTSNNVKVNGKSINKRPVEKAALVAATLAKGINADLYHFATTCSRVKFNHLDTTNTIKNKMIELIGQNGHGTDFGSIFSTLPQYDRIFIISDLQGAHSMLHNSSLQTYNKKYGVPYIYTIDMVGYGTTMFRSSQKLIELYGYGADIYEYVKKAEIDPKAILKEIEDIRI
jgi:hypothetical protein